MKKIFKYCLIVCLTIIFVQSALADNFKARVKKSALSRGIDEVHEVCADIKSLIKSKNGLKIEFEYAVRIGVQYVTELSFGWKMPEALLSIPEKTKKVRIYWGYEKGSSGTIIALEKLPDTTDLSSNKPVNWTVRQKPAKTPEKSDSYSDRMKPLFLKKTPIAIPDFEIEETMSRKEQAKKHQKILKTAVEFTGYLEVMDLKTVSNGSASDISDPNQIDFNYWKKIGAKLLITGSCTDGENGNIKLILRLFSTATKSYALVDQVYTGPQSDIRAMILDFCNEMSYMLTGKQGPFNSKIAFTSTLNNKREIFSCDFDGRNIRQVTHFKKKSHSPAWSADGNWMAFVSNTKGKQALFLKNITKNQATVIPVDGIDISPVWIPGRAIIASALDFSGDQDICLFSLHGKIIKRITNNEGNEGRPDFSPDGKKLAFVSDKNGSFQIYIKDIQTGRTKRLTQNKGHHTSPAWSHTGDRIAYSSKKNGKHDIFIINPDGTGSYRLTEKSGSNEHPSWSPDDNLLVFSSTRELGIPKLYIMTAAGTGQRRLLTMDGSQSEPDWSMPITSP